MSRIQTKITMTYLFLAVLIVVGVSVVISFQVESYFRHQLVENLLRQSDVLSYALSRQSFPSARAFHQEMSQFAQLQHVRVTLIDENGIVLSDSDVLFTSLPSIENHLDRPEIQQALHEQVGQVTRHSATVGRDFLYVAKRLDNSPMLPPLGTVRYIRLSMPLEEVQEKIGDIRKTILVAGLLVLVVIVAVSLVVSKRIATPMVRIARSAAQIRSGDLDERIEISSDDEVGQVARAVNELVDKLKADIVQLKKLEQVRREFLGNVSHELRTPIFAIQGFLETLLNGAVNDPAVNRSFLEKAQSNAARLNTLLEELINISQIESGEMKMSFRYFPLNEFLEAVEREVRPIAQMKNIQLRLDAQTGEQMAVYGDKERLHQVMINLIDNAVKYNTENGTIRLTAEERDGLVTVSVKDTGIGIAPEHLPRIFERFYRVDKDRSREVGGTGLGLAIVKHILEAHGSKVEVESKPGSGSIFFFVLKKG